MTARARAELELCYCGRGLLRAYARDAAGHAVCGLCTETNEENFVHASPACRNGSCGMRCGVKKGARPRVF